MRFTETLAEEVRESNIQANAIAPGAVNTRMLEEVLAAGESRVGSGFWGATLKQEAEGGTPPERAAELAVFLASSESDHITGKLISAVWDDWRSGATLNEPDFGTLRRIDYKHYFKH